MQGHEGDIVLVIVFQISQQQCLLQRLFLSVPNGQFGLRTQTPTLTMLETTRFPEP